MEQNAHTSDDGSMEASPCVDVIIPPSDGDARDVCELKHFIKFNITTTLEMRLAKHSVVSLFRTNILILVSKC